MKVVCINSGASLINSNQLIEGKTYYAYGFFPGFSPENILVRLEGVEGVWDYDRFIPASVEFEIEEQIFDALK